ncbi:sin3 histone deacetylase corepressor complex component SDS3-like isoform X2 [Amphiura filiformis]|uniref:sin3 histone deacetylase corepressor complex component SDS3-like isoform X2 n=1 Tax=Amphiura filiformis TaxID=82378 RepID=UPI003B2274D1
MTSKLSSFSAANGLDPGHEYDFSDSEDKIDVYKYNEQESDEDTEDASETDAAKLEEEFTEMKEQIYKEKLASLKKQLQQLNDGTHPELNRKLKKIEQQYKDRLRYAEAVRNYEIELVEREYIKEKKQSSVDFERKKIELKENIVIELDDKKRMVEHERTSLELTGADSMEVKPAITRKLRRRPNEPLPMQESKRRKPSPAQFMFQLSEEEVAADLKTISKGKLPVNKKSASGHSSGSGSGAASNANSHKYVVKISDGKLFYEKRWFHRGQNIYIDSKDTGKVSAVISSIGTNEIWVRKTADNQKSRIYISQMQKGKYKIRKRST